MPDLIPYQTQVNIIHQKLGIPADYAKQRNLILQPEATELVDVETNAAGRLFQTTRPTALAWRNMQETAANDGVTLQIGSAFRSITFQLQLIEYRLAKGRTLDDILRGIAAPGFSEHHTGQAIDIITPDSTPFTEHFELTEAFTWLRQHANHFGFYLSYPRDNPFGFVYEPWHWRFHSCTQHT